MGQIQSVMLLDRRAFAALFDGAKIYGERFLGFTKSLIATRDCFAQRSDTTHFATAGVRSGAFKRQ